MKKLIKIGVDRAKNSFQIHALTDEDGSAVTRKLRRTKTLEFFAQIEPCRIGREACARRTIGRANLTSSGTMCS